MNDLFSKICLGVIAASLATLAYVELASYRQEAPTAAPQQVARTGLTKTACAEKVMDLTTTMAALQEQIKNVPALVEKTDKNGNVIGEYPNPLYEQLMLQLMEIRTQQEALQDRCPA